MLHTALAASVAALCLWAIVNPRLHTCIAGTAGLLCIGVAALLSLDYYSQPVTQLLLGGMLLCGLQVLWTDWRERHPAAPPSTDWPADGYNDPPQETDSAHHRHIAGGKQ